MQPTERHRVTGASARSLFCVRLAAVVVVAVGGVLAITSQLATASTLDGTATIATPGTLTPLTSGGSTTQFTVTLPAAAACTGDTSTGGYHVFSYLLPAGTAVTTLNFSTQVPSSGFGLVDPTGAYFGPVNTAITTGQVVGIPQELEWAPVVTTDAVYTAAQLTASASNPWQTGVACANSSGAVTDYWNANITFVAATSDPTGFTWSVASGTTPTTTTTDPASTTTTTTAGTSTTATTSAGSTTATTSAAAATSSASGGTGSAGGGTSSGTSSGSTSPSSSSGSGTLAFTGLPTAKGIGLGLLAIGIGLMLIGWAPRRVRLADAATRGRRWP